MQLRIHHFFDIIRDFGSGKQIIPHAYGHAYHVLAQQIRENPELTFTLCVAADAICKGCTHLFNGACDDVISHRADFKQKEDFNNYLDERIMEVCNLSQTPVYSPKILCEMAHHYLENIELIYEGNDAPHTQKRKENVLKGLHYYTQKHKLNLAY